LPQIFEKSTLIENSQEEFRFGTGIAGEYSGAICYGDAINVIGLEKGGGFC